MDFVSKYILDEHILPEWDDADNCAPYEDSIGTDDILFDLGIMSDELRDDLMGALPDNRWVRKT